MEKTKKRFEFSVNYRIYYSPDLTDAGLSEKTEEMFGNYLRKLAEKNNKKVKKYLRKLVKHESTS